MGEGGSFVLAGFKLRGYDGNYIATLTMPEYRALKSQFQITDCKIIHYFPKKGPIDLKNH